MKITLTDNEGKYLEDAARAYNVDLLGLVETVETVLSSNFEQDVNDILNDYADDIRLEDGEFKGNKSLDKEEK